MSREYTMWNEYYEQRKAKLDKINVPMYVTASWTNFLHARGTMRGWIETTQVREKWLRVHNSNEWPDLYYPENVEDYRKFLDYYMKDVSNGWQFTSTVRLSVLNPGHKDVVNRPTASFPIASQQSVSMFLDAKNNALSWNDQQPHKSSFITIAGTGDLATFVHTFSSRVELTGFFALKIYVSSATNAEDIDIFCKTSKLSVDGQLLESCCVDVGYLAADPEKERAEIYRLHREKNPSIDSVWFAEGTHGRLRASHRELDTSVSSPHWPRYTHSNFLPLSAGGIVPLIIEMWPLGMIWEAGEKLQLSIAGFNLRPEGLSMLPPVQTCNAVGSLINVYTGGQYDSHLLVPHIPAGSM